VPTIVFHGADDRTVVPANAAAILDALDGPDVVRRIERVADVGGRGVERTLHVDAAGRTFAELWLLEGAAHAWSGGSTDGSFTDPRGPDASAEMVRFFLASARG
jgi:poly(3-hydroxybutyrate) depolymerase